MSSSTLRFGIVGCGRIGQRHAEHVHRAGQLVAVCDIDINKASQLAQQHQCKAYASLSEMLDSCKIDIVSICTPNGLHAEQSIQSLRSGCHVLCEKPMAITSYDCEEMIKEAEKANRKLFIVKQNRFNPPVAELKRVIEEGKLGKILSVQLNCFWNRNEAYYANSWKGTKDLDGGTLFTQFSHFIDLLYWLFGDIKETKAFLKNSNHQGIIEFEDQGVVALEFYNGVQATIHYTVNSFQKNMEGSITVFGQMGTVKVGGQYLNELEYQQINNYTIGELPKGNAPNHYGEYVGSMSNHDKVYDNIIEVMNGKASIATSGFEGLKTVEIIEKIYKSASYNSTTQQ